MNPEFLKTRRFRVGLSILIASAALFLMTNQLRRISFSEEKVLKIGVFSDNYWGVQNGYANKIIDDADFNFIRAADDPGPYTEFSKTISSVRWKVMVRRFLKKLRGK